MTPPEVLEYAKAFGIVVASVTSLVTAFGQIYVRRELFWQSKALKQQMLRSGSVPPPRDRLPTLTELNDPWTDIDKEIKRTRK
jgi:hypothetical protein